MTEEHPIHRVVTVEPCRGFRLRLRFDDGCERVVDLERILRGELFGPLRDPMLFQRAAVDPESGAVVWPNGADLDPALLHDWPRREAAMRRLASRWS